ncbi:MAG: hypothetical protein KGY70_17900, partial [Bacteroidales bacterium]|nr:hypothetical protein [Bacteroidales bacterium]
MEQSRRNFLKKAALGSAGVLMLNQLGFDKACLAREGSLSILSNTGSGVQSDSLDILGKCGRKVLWSYLMRISAKQYAERDEEFDAALESCDKLIKRRNELKEVYRDLIGQLPEKKTPLNAKVTGVHERDGYRVENVIYESRPSHRVTANLYIPAEGNGPWPGVLVACGHTDAGKASYYQAISALLAKNGMVALCYDPICQGERYQYFDKRHGTTGHTLLNLGSLLVGRSVVGYEAWDGVRSIDYLLSRPEVDKDKQVGLTGTSGGGTQTTFLMALDGRIGPAAPSCYLMRHHRLYETLGPSDGCQHLPCEGKYGIDRADYVLMHAPEPTAILAARRDDLFEIQSAREVGADAEKMYATLGESECFEFFESDTEHGFTPPHREKATRWMRRWLCNEDKIVPEEDDVKKYPDHLKKLEGQLQCTQSGQVLKEFSDEKSVADLNFIRARQLSGAREEFWEDHSTDECLAKIRRLIGCRQETSEIRVKEAGSLDRDSCRIKKLVIEREGEVPVPALLFVPLNCEGELPATLYVDGRGNKKEAGPDGAVMQLVNQNRIVLSIDARGFGETADHGSNGKHCNTEHRVAVLARDIGRPLMGQRVEDIMAALDVLVEQPN